MNETLQSVLKSIDKAKGYDTLVYKFNTLNPFIDYVVITTASNLRQVNALAEYIREDLLANELTLKHIEGTKESKWVLVDADTVIVHIFEENERQVYALEKLYAGCETVTL